jgi:ParD-like antitoxin of type II bacterial toxin-antitoxin system
MAVTIKKKAGVKQKTIMKAAQHKLKSGPVSVRFERADQGLLRIVEARAASGDRSLGGQIKHYVRLAAIAEDNPDLPMSMIQGILEAQAEIKAGLAQPYQWGVIPNA